MTEADKANEPRRIIDYWPFLSTIGFAYKAVSGFLKRDILSYENGELWNSIRNLRDQYKQLDSNYWEIEADARKSIEDFGGKYIVAPLDEHLKGYLKGVTHHVEEHIKGTFPNGTRIGIIERIGKYKIPELVETISLEEYGEIIKFPYGVAGSILENQTNINTQIAAIKDTILLNNDLIDVSRKQVLDSILWSGISFFVSLVIMYATNPKNFKQAVREIPDDFNNLKNHLKSLYNV